MVSNINMEQKLLNLPEMLKVTQKSGMLVWHKMRESVGQLMNFKNGRLINLERNQD